MNLLDWCEALVVARHLLAEKAFDGIDIYEQQSEVGGLWNYPSVVPSEAIHVPDVGPHGPLDQSGEIVMDFSRMDCMINSLPIFLSR